MTDTAALLALAAEQSAALLTTLTTLAASAPEGSHLRSAAEHWAKYAASARSLSERCRAAAEEDRRPKGTSVRVLRTGFLGRVEGETQAEFVRCTRMQVVLRVGPFPGAQEERFRLTDGWEVSKGRRLRIAPEDLERIRAEQ